MTMTPCPAFIDGQWREITGVEKSPVYNPSRGEVIAAARARTAALSARAVGLLLQQWVGGAGSGYWQTLPVRRGELVTAGKPDKLLRSLNARV